ncbi:hypothetical protein JCM14635_27540 [Megalodesulfovibrio paquesii]
MRGDAYFRQGRVRLDRATPREITAVVAGTETWRCSILDLNNRLHLDCNCPHFRGGHACKHLWAAILAADDALADAPPRATPLAPHIAPRPAAVPPPDWRTLLMPAPATAPSPSAPSTAPGRWDGAPGHFLLRYELLVRPEGASLTVIRQAVLKSGEPGKHPAPAPLGVVHEPDLPDHHRAVLELLLLGRLAERPGAYVALGGSTFQDCPLSASRPPCLLSRMLPLLAATGQCRVLQVEGVKRIVADPLRRGEPFEAGIDYAVDPESVEKQRKELVYLPQIRLGEGQHARLVPLAEVRVLFAGTPMHCIVDGALHALPGVSLDWIRSLRTAGHRIQVPKHELKALVQTPEGARLPLPAALGPRLVPSSLPSPCLEIDCKDGQPVTARLWMAYGELEIAADDSRQAILDAEAWTRMDRQPSAEQQFLERLRQLDLPAKAEPFYLPACSLWELVHRLEPLRAEGWTLRTRDRQALATGAAASLRLGARQDWFELDGAMDFGGVIVPLPTVVRAYLRGERTMTLEHEGLTVLGVLPEAWLRRHARALGLGLQDPDKAAKAGSLRFHPALLPLVDGLLEEDGLRPFGVSVAMDRTIAERRKALRGFREIVPPAVPASFTGTLRPYQHETLGWLDALAALGCGGILADDMGLGKTIQILAWLALAQEREAQTAEAGTPGATLILVPTSLLGTWQAEAARFCPGLRVFVHSGPEREARLMAALGQTDIVLATYGILRRDLDLLRRVPWRRLVLDESQAVKNPDSQTAKAVRALRAGHRLCLTGTPLENRLEELWSQLQICTPGLLGARGEFEARFVRPMSKPESEEAAQARGLLQRLLKPFILRRTKAAVAPDLPEKQEAVLRCEMPAAQARLYARLRDHYRGEILAAVEAEGMDRSRFTVLEGLLRLRQAACHPALVGDPKAASGKLDTLMRALREVLDEGHKALIFSQFTSFLDLIRTRLTAEGIAHEHLDGSTTAKARAAKVTAFQDPAGPPVFCISLKAGGVGLTLTAADYVFLMDPWWNPAVEAQAMDRTHRIGQTRKVFAYRLVSEGTVDEKVLALQAQKKDLAALLDEAAATDLQSLSSLSREDLELLLG